MTNAHIDSDRSDPGGVTWWRADVPLRNPLTSYRFLLEGGAAKYCWVNESGLVRHDVADSLDFRLVADSNEPSWLNGTVGYQIFLDRFASSGTTRACPDWAIAEEWEAPLAADPGVGTQQWFGGDLAGIEQRLDHLERLGVNLVYLTPFFPARSSHRYDASTFDAVDPLLGGDAALASLIAAAHARDIRVIGDITLNHTGDRHTWFTQAKRDLSTPEADFYLFGDGPDDYVAWHDVPSLPKLDHRSDDLARRLYRGADSVIGKYLDDPFGLDGWRVDCANTTGRNGLVDVNQLVAADARATIDEHTDEGGWLVAEHCYDAGADLCAGGWHGAMAYQWWTRPLWSWLRGDRPLSLMSQIEVPHLDGATVVASMRGLGGNVPWAARAASMTMLDSHDTARFRTVVGGDRERHLVGMAALLTMPGVPTIFAGSEVGVEGDSMDSGRVPFPWTEAEWDAEFFEATRSLIAVRSASPALRCGSMRWVDATDDSITFVREVDDDIVIVHLRRTACGDIDIPISTVVSRPRCLARTTALCGTPPMRVDDVLRFAGDTGASIVRCDLDDAL